MLYQFTVKINWKIAEGSLKSRRLALFIVIRFRKARILINQKCSHETVIKNRILQKPYTKDTKRQM